MFIDVLTPKTDENGVTLEQKTVQVTQFAFDTIYSSQGFEMIKTAKKTKKTKEEVDVND